MDLYKLPKIKNPFKKKKDKKEKPLYFIRKRIFVFTISIILFSSLFGFLGGILSFNYFTNWSGSLFSGGDNMIFRQSKEVERIIEKTVTEQAEEKNYEEKIINVVEKASPAVVSIIVRKEIAVGDVYLEPFQGLPFEVQTPEEGETKKERVGSGSGFIISKNGMVLTNKHVVMDEEAEFSVLLSEGREFEAKVLAKDPLQDLAIIKIVDGENKLNGNSLPILELGDSSGLKIGETVIAIGNALGEFQNTVSSGIISGLGRTITASGGGEYVETIENVIQTDAAINKGNSGGPLLNNEGEVIGINTAVSIQGENIGFAIPINRAKRDINQIKETGKISYAFLGVRYVIINEEVKQLQDLDVNYGALISSSKTEPAIIEGSAADKAGLKAGDIILEFDNQKITRENTLAQIIKEYSPRDQVILVVLRGDKKVNLSLKLGEKSSE